MNIILQGNSLMNAKVKIMGNQFLHSQSSSDNPFVIVPYNDNHRQQLLEVWEASVAATHHFLSPGDFKEIKEAVWGIDFNHFTVFCLLHNDEVKGFLGVADKKVEMLFISPGFTGKGFGKKLMDFAVKELSAGEVDVNEQNEKAVQFYKKYGFEVYERTEKDGQGKDYPILKMKLNQYSE